MKTIGLIGGMSWESSKVYYELINRIVREKLGGFHSCKSLMYSVDFAVVEDLQHRNEWIKLEELMVDAAQALERGGADLIVLCTNTMHLCSQAIIDHTSIPFLHIAEATAEAIQEKKLRKVGLLGTQFTMEKDFYKRVIKDNYDIDVIIPDPSSRRIVHDIIYQELVHGIITDSSRDRYKAIIGQLVAKGGEGIILGCTEIPLLISEQDVEVPIFDTTVIHAEKAVQFILQN